MYLSSLVNVDAEVEKLKVLQSEREALKTRIKQKEHEKKAENHTETVCPECGGRQLVHDYERAELVCQSCGLSSMMISSTAVPSGVRSTTTSG